MQTFSRPRRQKRQVWSTEPSQGTPMRSPLANRRAASPVASTRPTIMWPITSGSLGSFSSPFTMWRSVRHTAQAETSMRISPRPGAGMGSSTRRRGSLAARSCIALIDCPLGGDAALERCLQRDRRGRQRLGDRTIILGLLRHALEGCLVDARDVAFGRKLDARHPPSRVALVEMHGRLGSNFLRLMTGLREPVGERHRKTAGVRRADQLLRIGAGTILHPALERIRSLEGAAPQPHRSRSILERLLPYGFRGTYRHLCATSLS